MFIFQTADGSVSPHPSQLRGEEAGKSDDAHDLLFGAGLDRESRRGALGAARAHHDGGVQLLQDPEAAAVRSEGHSGQGKHSSHLILPH